MENLYNQKMAMLGYDQLVCNIFVNWENVKDEILIQERKTGSGNGTIHVFLGAADTQLKNEFNSYYSAVENGEDPAINAVEVKHIFLASNVVSMLGYVCKYYHSKNQQFAQPINESLELLKNYDKGDGFLVTKSLFKLATGPVRPYFKQFDSNGVFVKLIRQILLPNSAYKISLYKNANNEYAAFWLIGFDWQTNFDANSSTLHLEEPKTIQIIKAKQLTSFVLSTVKYFYSIDKLNSLIPYSSLEDNSSYLIKISKEGVFYLVGMFLQSTIDDVKQRNDVRVPRWFEDKFTLGDRDVYLSKMWSGKGEYQLTLSDFIKMIQTCYGEEYEYRWVDNEHQLWKINGSVNDNTKQPLQQIYYGAPGTGKSHTINEITKAQPEDNVVRTTFHPDSDYSTFVGAYKPTTKKVAMRDVTGKIIIENGKEVTEDRIVYEFVEQAFLQAYTRAWKLYARATNDTEAQPQYLIIEEINRGNCAQIFGDLFQLLDRGDSGFSEYPIKADNDMQKQLAKAFNGIAISNPDSINQWFEGKDIAQKVLSGEVLLLPKNLFIWATMNTSDQSLFPIDSAFKRRWDWKYVPIANAQKNWTITANGNQYDWWQFLEKINAEIEKSTHSEDKKLGYFFCKAKNGTVDAETFVGKVVFYLWNDVFKDFVDESGDLFKDDEGRLTFDKFYTIGADNKTKVVEAKIERFLQNLGKHRMSRENQL